MALLMKESNEILSIVYRATPNLFQRFMPHLPSQMANQSTGVLPIHIPMKYDDELSDDENQESPRINSHQIPLNFKGQINSQNNSSPAFSPNSNELSIDQNCTPPSSSSSTNSTITSVSPLDFNSFVTAAASSTPVMSPLMMPAAKYPYEVKNILNNPETVCETAARLLFMCVRWAKSIPAFVNLDMSDQLALLEEGWREIFILSAAQFQMPLDIASLLSHAGLNSENTSSEKLIKIMSEMRNFQEILNKLKQAQVDSTEFACLKAITLFKTTLSQKLEHNEIYSSSSSSSSSSSLDSSILTKPNLAQPKDLQSIISFQDQTQLTLSKYDSSAYPTQPFRFGKLLLLLPALRSVSSQTIEELFFKKTIGNISIERVILDMYKSPMANV